MNESVWRETLSSAKVEKEGLKLYSLTKPQSRVTPIAARRPPIIPSRITLQLQDLFTLQSVRDLLHLTDSEYYFSFQYRHGSYARSRKGHWYVDYLEIQRHFLKPT